MAGTQTPSIDWPRRTDPLTGLEDLLKQNPRDEVAPQEERIPVNLLRDYILAEVNVLTAFTTTLFDNLDGTYDIDNGVQSITIDTTADSNPIIDSGGFYASMNVEGALQEIGATLDTLFTSVVTDNSDGTYTHDDGNGNTILIDTRANSNPIIDAGNYYSGTTVEEALQEIGLDIDNINDFTSVLTDNSDGTYTHNDGNGTIVTIDTTADSNPIIDVGGFYTSSDVEGALQEIGLELDGIDDFTSVLTDNGDGTYTHNDGNGTIVTIDTTADSNPIIDSGGYYTSTDVEGALQEIGLDLDNISDFTSVLTDNGDGTYSHNDGNGTIVTIDTRANSNPIIDAGGYYTSTDVEGALQEIGLDINNINDFTSVLTDNGDGTYTHNDGNGTIVTIDTTADSNPIIDAGGYYTSTNVEGALQEIGLDLDNINDFTSVLTNNGNGTYTHNDGNGTIVTIDTNAASNNINDIGNYYTSTNVEGALQEIGLELDGIDDFTSVLTDNGDGTYTHNDGNGTIVTINTNAVSNNIIDTGNYYSGTTVEEALQEIAFDLNNLSGSTTGTTSSLTNNGNGTYTHNDGLGNLITIDTRANSNPIIDAGGYYTSTDVEGALQEIGLELDNISGNTSSVTDNGNSTYTHDDGTGNTQLIDTRADSNSIIDVGNYYTGTTVEQALQEIGFELDNLSGSTTGATSSVTDNSDGTYTHNDGTGNTELIDTRANSNPIIDAGGYYTSSDVEGALQEIGLELDNLTITGETHTDGAILWVSKEGGNNTTGQRGNQHKPFADPWAARDSATEGDIIYVLNGQWTFGDVSSGADVEGTIEQLNFFSGFTTGIHYYFSQNTSITHVNSGSTISATTGNALFEDNVGLNCSVRGYLNISFVENTQTNNIISLNNDGGLHIFEFESFKYSNYGFNFQRANNLQININKVRPHTDSNAFFSFRELGTVDGLYVSANINDYFGSETDAEGLVTSLSSSSDVILSNSNISFNFKNVYKEEEVNATSYVGRIFGLQNNTSLIETNLTINCDNLLYLKTTGSIPSGTTSFQQSAIQIGGARLSGSTVTYNISNCTSDYCCIRTIGCTDSEAGYRNSFINVFGNFVSNESLVIHLDSLADPSGNGTNKHIYFQGRFVSNNRQIVGDNRAAKEEANITISGDLKTEASSVALVDLKESITLKNIVLENDGTTAPITTSNVSNLEVICMGVYANSLTEGTNIIEKVSPIKRDITVKI